MGGQNERLWDIDSTRLFVTSSEDRRGRALHHPTWRCLGTGVLTWLGDIVKSLPLASLIKTHHIRGSSATFLVLVGNRGAKLQLRAIKLELVPAEERDAWLNPESLETGLSCPPHRSSHSSLYCAREVLASPGESDVCRCR